MSKKTKKEEAVETPKTPELEIKDTTPIAQEGEFKIKSAKKMKNLGEQGDSNVIKVDLSKKEKTQTKEKDAVQEQETNAGDVHVKKQEDKSSVQEVVKEIRPSIEDDAEKQEIDSPLQLISDEDNKTNKSGVAGSDEVTTSLPEQKEIPKEVETQKLPENIDKLIKFMKETGGDIVDYTRLNADYTDVDSDTLLHEYYKTAKPHLNAEERGFIIEDSFSFDEELDEARDIRKKKLAYKEEVAKATNFLEDLKVKYYDEIKLRPGVTQDQQKATDFFSRYNEEQKVNKEKHNRFISKSKELLNEDFKGFDFDLGDKKFRYSIKDPVSVADNQTDISNFIGKFLNKEGEVAKHKEYHKALYAAQNADAMAQHFYEQGKTDAIKDSIAKSKNITTEARKTNTGEVFIGGLKVKAITGLDSSKLKIKKRTFN
jgi:hypothetical protein|tara:strand:- start:654 stop:1937 length:1284 start_codon:yes stop_codon:yes gene_type:complete